MLTQEEKSALSWHNTHITNARFNGNEASTVPIKDAKPGCGIMARHPHLHDVRVLRGASKGDEWRPIPRCTAPSSHLLCDAPTLHGHQRGSQAIAGFSLGLCGSLGLGRRGEAQGEVQESGVVRQCTVACGNRCQVSPAPCSPCPGMSPCRLKVLVILKHCHSSKHSPRGVPHVCCSRCDGKV